MTQKTRDYKTEYRCRIASGKARGYSRSQASGHPNLRIGESGISAKNKTAFPQDTPQDNPMLLVATSPCVGCQCPEGTPATCGKLDMWLRTPI